MTMPNAVFLNKPYGYLSQFSDADGHPGLGRLLPHLLGSEYRPAGRLDRDSEGLLVITDSGPLNARITQPRQKLRKLYWVQVEGEPDSAQLDALRRGVMLKDGLTLPARATTIDPADLWPREPPIRVRKTVPTSWIALAISEGRNRQVRRMTAAVGLPTLRLVRMAIGPWQLQPLQPGQYRAAAVSLPRR